MDRYLSLCLTNLIALHCQLIAHQLNLVSSSLPYGLVSLVLLVCILTFRTLTVQDVVNQTSHIHLNRCIMLGCKDVDQVLREICEHGHRSTVRLNRRYLEVEKVALLVPLLCDLIVHDGGEGYLSEHYQLLGITR